MKKKILTLIIIFNWIIMFKMIPIFCSSEVAPDGSFNYSIPINLPPATGGIGPELALTYNSESGNGLVGVGWSLSGYDCISRDNRYTIKLKDNPYSSDVDHFLYMGQSLYRNTTTGYYHTERENYLRIEQCTNGPNGNGYYWVVTDKNGVKKYYGSRTVSAVGYGGGYIFSKSGHSPDPARIWILDKVEDVNGNYYTIDYIQNENFLSSEIQGWRPHQIIYTRNNNPSSFFGAYRAVTFEYEDRLDNYSDSRPTAITNNKRLTKINVYTNVTLNNTETIDNTNSTLHHYYQLSYSPYLKTCYKSMLKEFREYNYNGESKPPLRFEYTPNHQVNMVLTKSDSSMLLQPGGYYSGDLGIISNADFNGDGKDDIMTSANRVVTIYFSKPESDDDGIGFKNGGFSTTYQEYLIFYEEKWQNYQDYYPELDCGPYNDGTQKTIKFGDFNGDGAMDFMLFLDHNNSGTSDVYWAQYLSKLNPEDPNKLTPEFVRTVINFGHAPYFIDKAVEINAQDNTVDSNVFRAGDFNGDGKTDLISLTDITFLDINNSIHRFAYNRPWRIFLADENGNGFNKNNNGIAESIVYNPRGVNSNYGDYYSFNPSYFNMNDFNGDGCMDFLVYEISDYSGEYHDVPIYKWTEYLSNLGKASFDTSFTVSQTDIDFVNFTIRNIDDPDQTQTVPPQLYFFDFNGDGKTDVLAHEKAFNSWGTYLDLQNQNCLWRLYIADPISHEFNVSNYKTISTENVEYLSSNCFGDFNGDGMTDIIIYYYDSLSYLPGPKSLTYSMYTANGKTLEPSYILQWIKPRFDGFYYNTDNNGYYTYNSIENCIKLGDFDGNGMTDIMYRHCDICVTYDNTLYYYNDHQWSICTSRGRGDFFTSQTIDIGNNNWDIAATGNFMGDGKTSFIVDHNTYVNTRSVPCDLYKPQYTTRANLLTSIYNGEGGTIEINYTPAPAFVPFKPFVDGEIHVYDYDSEEPIVPENGELNLNVPDTSMRNLVKNIKVHSGVLCYDPDNNATPKDDIVGYTAYSYYNGMFYPGKITSRYSLGFERIEAVDKFTDARTVTYYHQYQPYQGLIKAIETYGSDAGSTYYYNESSFNKDYNGILMTIKESVYESRHDQGSPEKVKFIYKKTDKLKVYNNDDINDFITYETQYTDYDSYGNITVSKNLGNPNTESDDIETRIYYAINTTSNLMKVYKTQTLGKNVNNQIETATLTINYFDNSSTEGYIDKGHLTTILSIGGESPDSKANFAYDAWGNCTKIWDSKSILTEKKYDKKYHMLVELEQVDPEGLNMTTGYTYDQFMNQSSTRDTNNVATRIIYDGFNAPVKILGPNDTTDDPSVITFYDYSTKELNSDGLLDISNIKRQIVQTKPSIPDFYSKLTYTYFDGLGHVIRGQVTSDNGRKWITTDSMYDHSGRLYRKSVPYIMTKSTPEITLDTWNQPHVRTYFDNNGRAYKTSGPQVSANGEPAYTQTIYGLSWTGIIDRKGHYTKTEVAGNIKTAIEYTGTYPDVTPYASTVTKEYRGGSTVNDAKGNITTTVIDMLGRKIRITSPDMGTWSFVYDANGNKIQQTNAKDETIYYTYDNINRIKTINYSSGTSYDNVIYTYDQADHGLYAKGKLTTITYAGAGSIDYYYNDKMGKLTAKKVTIDGESRTESYTYYPSGLLNTKTLPDNEVITYKYNFQGLLNSVYGIKDNITTNYIIETNYNDCEQVETLIKGNNKVTAYNYYDTANEYDADSGLSFSYLLKSETTGLSGTFYNYQHDKNGFITKKESLDNFGDSSDYTYDEMNRLTGVNSTTFGTISYSYDTVGNITSKDGYSFIYYEGTNRLKFDGRKYYHYDLNGNLIYKSTNPNFQSSAKAQVGTNIYSDIQSAYENAETGLIIKTTAGIFSGNIIPSSSTPDLIYFSGGWDDTFTNIVGYTTLGGQIINNLKQLSFDKYILSGNGGTDEFYTYDYNNMLTSLGSSTYSYFGENRIKKVENGVTTKYFFDDYEEETGSTTNIIKYYPGGAMHSTKDGLLYIYKDITGNTSVITDANGNLVNTFTYDPFGYMKGWTDDPGIIKYRFAGEEHDASGLTYMGARYYDPVIGRFITGDIFVQNGTPQCLNRYSYCGNNPVNYSDPTGHSYIPSFDIIPYSSIGTFIQVLDKVGIHQINFGIWFGIGGSLSINCGTGDLSIEGGFGYGLKAGVATSYADIGGNCSMHTGLGYNTADKSIFFSAGSSAILSNYGTGTESIIGYSFQNHVGYQSVSYNIGAASFGYSMYGRYGDAYLGINFLGLSGSLSIRNGFSIGASLTTESGNSVGADYNVSNGAWRGSVGLDMCFVAGTKIETNENLKNIEDIKTGDIVKSYNEKTGEFGYKEVIRTFINHTDKISIIKIEEEIIECTEEHPFWIVNDHTLLFESAVMVNFKNQKQEHYKGKWVSACKLKPGMKLLSSSGILKDIISVEIVNRNTDTYNFEVTDWHTYCVGKENLVVHNNCLDIAMSQVGKNLYDGDGEYSDFISYNKGTKITPKTIDKHSTTCGLFILGVLRAMGIQDQYLDTAHKNGAIAGVIAIAIKNKFYNNGGIGYIFNENGGDVVIGKNKYGVMHIFLIKSGVYSEDGNTFYANVIQGGVGYKSRGTLEGETTLIMKGNRWYIGSNPVFGITNLNAIKMNQP